MNDYEESQCFKYVQAARFLQSSTAYAPAINEKPKAAPDRMMVTSGQNYEKSRCLSKGRGGMGGQICCILPAFNSKYQLKP